MLRNFFTYRSFLSRVGFALVFAFFVFLAVSYIKGIQILMLVPALVAGIFIYSWWDTRRILSRSVFSLSRWPFGSGQALFARIPEKLACSIRLAYRDPRGVLTFLEKHRWSLAWEMPDSPEGGKIVLFVSGRFDILRRLVSVPPAPRSTPVSARQFPRVEDGYPMVREYEPGDFAGRIDPLRSSTKDEPYVRVPHSETTSTHQTTTDNRIRISSNVALSDHRPDEGSWLGKWLIIGICIAIVTLQWESILLSGSLLLTIATVLALEWWFGRGRGGRLAKNGSVICAFVFMVVMTFSTGEMAGAGSVFLIQVLILKRLFPDEGEDAFLFLFLGLFVFVAVSLFALQFWFMAFFLVYLLVALALLRSAAGYSDQFALRSMVHTEWSRLSSFLSSVSILTLMGVFFLVLPHGDSDQTDNSSMGASAQSEAVSGFAGEIDLNAVGRIKSDTSKKIVVQDLRPGDQQRFSGAYWRWERFTRFANGRWHRDLWGDRLPIDPTTSSDDAYEIVYSTLGSDRLFFPAVPTGLSLDGLTPLNAFSSAHDSTIIALPSPTRSTLHVRASFALDRSGEFHDLPDTTVFDSSMAETSVPEDVTLLFEKFWANIDEQTAASPNLLTAYVRDHSWFTYSIDAPARDLASFLYEERRGHCEYFATVLAVTLQHFWYPATLVNGFYGGESNDLGNAWIVRGKDAHSWVEIRTDSGEWRRYDATPPIWDEDALSLLGITTATAVNIYDYLDLRWYSHVAGYDAQTQYELLWAVWSIRWRLVGILLIALAFIPLVLLGRWWAHRIRESESDRMLRHLRSYFGSDFPLARLSTNYPDLVMQTRRALYGNPFSCDRSLRELDSDWYTIQKEHSDRTSESS